MTWDRSRVRWGALVAGITLALVAFSFARPRTWSVLGYDPYPPAFADLVAILAAGQAYEAGLDVYADNPFDPYGRPHVYGPLWLATGALGLTTGDAGWLGVLLAVAFVAVATLVLAPRDLRSSAAALLLLGSPPVLLGLNRGNNDLVVVLLLTLAAACSVRRTAASGLVAGLALGLGALLKIYPLAAWPALVLREQRGRRATWLLLASLAAFLAAGWIWRDDFHRLFGLVPRPRAPYHGARAFVDLYFALPGFRWDLLLGWVGGIALVALPAFRPRTLWEAMSVSGFSAVCYVAGGLTWVFCYAVNVNYPYRLALLVLPARAWLAELSQPGTGRLVRAQLWLWLGAMWLVVPRHALEDAARQAPSLHDLSWVWLKLVLGLEQGVVLMLTLLLAITCAGVLARRCWPKLAPARA